MRFVVGGMFSNGQIAEAGWSLPGQHDSSFHNDEGTVILRKGGAERDKGSHLVAPIPALGRARRIFY